MKKGNSITIFTLLLSLLLVSSRPAAAGETLIGVVMTGNTPYYSDMHQAFSAALDSIMPSGKKARIILQRPFPDPIALSNAARKLIAADVDLIVTYGSPATLAVLHERSRIPVVYAGVYDPATLTIAGKNVTGCGYRVPLSSLLRYLKSLKKLSTLSVVYCSNEEDSVRQAGELLKLTKQQNIGLNRINIKTSAELEKIISTISGDAAFITGSSIISLGLKDILAVLKKNSIPSVSPLPDKKELGVIITLYQAPAELGEKAAEMVAKILLLGKKPRDIKPEVFRNTELVFNLREARDMGVKIPINLVAEAIKVIK